MTTQSEITFTLPVEGEASVPVSGSIYIECFDQNKESHFTRDISFASEFGAGKIEDELVKGCPFLRDSFVVVGEKTNT